MLAAVRGSVSLAVARHLEAVVRNMDSVVPARTTAAQDANLAGNMHFGGTQYSFLDIYRHMLILVLSCMRGHASFNLLRWPYSCLRR
jgi:hypothetical protein